MLNHLIVVFVLTLIIHTAETLSYAIRFAGVRLNKIAVALSLTGIIVLVSRTANMLQAPLTATFVDHARNQSDFPLIDYMRVILFAASIGTICAIALFPSFVNLFSRIIAKLEVAGSIPRLITGVTIGQLINTKYYLRKPAFSFYYFRYLGIPKRLIVMNVFVTAFYTVGVMASLYSAFLLPAYSTTASQASGIINGLATIMLTIFIDPQLGLITDKALHHEQYRTQLGKVYVVMMTSRFLGTLLGQFILIPAAYFIGMVVKLL